MCRTWKQEKEYCTKRAAFLGNEMDAAIERGDKDLFKTLYRRSMRYMTKKQLSTYMYKFADAILAEKI